MCQTVMGFPLWEISDALLGCKRPHPQTSFEADAVTFGLVDSSQKVSPGYESSAVSHGVGTLF